MSDTETHEDCETCGRPLKDARTFKELREQNTTLETRLADAQRNLLDRTIRDAGLDPAAEIVQMLAEKYDGDWDGKAFAEFAAAKGLTPTAPATTEGAASQATDTERQLAALQAPGEAIRAAATQVPPPAGPKEQAAELERQAWAASDPKQRAALLDEAAAFKSQLLRQQADQLKPATT